MKKFKLIKKYPNSPSVGTELKTDCDGRWIQGIVGLTLGEVLQYNEFWEEVIEKDYEILSVRYALNNEIYVLNSNKSTFSYELGTITMDSVLRGNLTKNNQEKHAVHIHSVKRLSDGEVFTIGDKVTIQFNKPVGICNIVEIRLHEHGISISANDPIEKGHSIGGPLVSIIKVKKPLFTTEDGVDIFVGYDYYELITPNFHNKPCIWNILPSTARKNILYDQEGNRKNGRLWFSTKEKAEEYILMNKPCLSINDICNLISRKGFVGTSYLEERLKELVKQKSNL